jgi:hypothetical protein
VAVAGGLLLVSGVPPLTFGGDATSLLRIVGQKQTGNLVEVTLLNPGARTVTGKVVIQLATDGGSTLAVVPFTVWGGQKVSVVWSAPNPTDSIIRFGIIVDDGAPI